MSFGCEYKRFLSGYRALLGEYRFFVNEYRALWSASGRQYDAHHRRPNWPPFHQPGLFWVQYEGVLSGYRALSGEYRSLLNEYRALLGVLECD